MGSLESNMSQETGYLQISGCLTLSADEARPLRLGRTFNAGGVKAQSFFGYFSGAVREPAISRQITYKQRRIISVRSLIEAFDRTIGV